MESNIISFKIYPNIDFGFKFNKFILSSLISLCSGCNNIEKVSYEKFYTKKLNIKYTKYYIKLKRRNYLLNYSPFKFEKIGLPI